jgi:thiosulfate reductase cytochrome b subunit
VIRNISLLFFCLIVFFSSTLQAFDQVILQKTAQLLEEKKVISELRTKLFPDKYTQKKEINAQEYLECKREKLLTQYEQTRQEALKCVGWGTVFAIAGTLGMYGSLVCKSSAGFCVSFWATLFASVNALGGHYQLKRNPVIDNQKRKEEALLQMLDRKLVNLQNKIVQIKEIIKINVKECVQNC